MAQIGLWSMKSFVSMYDGCIVLQAKEKKKLHEGWNHTVHHLKQTL